MAPGGIASGKTYVSNKFSSLGVDIIDTDIIAHEIVLPGRSALEEITVSFGKSVLQKDGALNRKLMRKIVFEDSKKRLLLESILHPKIQNEVKNKILSSSGPYQIIVVPLLTKSSILKQVNRVLIVDCDEKKQLKRLIKRDGISTKLASQIISSQSDRKERLSIADDIILNDSDFDSLDAQMINLYRYYLDLSREDT
ncbi:MAG: dephospho-CoA kinase [Woeseiaceae bacterium]|nr:dephospho-CoA kinase [Woeseiaceae bacterium]